MPPTPFSPSPTPSLALTWSSLSEMPSTMHAVYFYFSLAFLIGRSLSVLLFVSAVHERARDPLRLLQLVPPSGYLSEVQRLANELSSDNVSLSGLRFFNVTRKLCLTVSVEFARQRATCVSSSSCLSFIYLFFNLNRRQVAGSIVTYELVLIQFHEDEKSWDCQAGKQ